MAGTITVTIKNWDKYNIRKKDYKNPWWFSLNNRVLEDTDVYELTDAEFRAWIYILSQASKAQRDTIEVVLDHASRVCKINPKALKNLVEKFSRKSILSESGQDPTSFRQESGHHRTEQDRTEQYSMFAPKPDEQACGAIEKFVGDDDVRALLKTVSHSAQWRWVKLYEDIEWLKREFIKASAWIETNPKKKPKKDYAKFLGSWLSRGFESHRKTLPSQKSKLKQITLPDWGKET